MSSADFPSRHGRVPAQTLQAVHVPEALLKIQTVTAIVGMSESTVRRRIIEGTFPPPVIKDGTRITRWVASDITNWLRARAAAKTSAPRAADKSATKAARTARRANPAVEGVRLNKGDHVNRSIIEPLRPEPLMDKGVKVVVARRGAR